MSESSESASRSDDEAIHIAKASVRLAGGRWTTDVEMSCRRVLRGERTVDEELNHFRRHLRTSEHHAEKAKIRAEILETMGTEEAKKITKAEAESLFVRDWVEE